MITASDRMGDIQTVSLTFRTLRQTDSEMISRTPSSSMARQTPTLEHVAKLAGVSQMTASRALNGRPGVSRETRDEVLRIASDIGYAVNRTAQKLSGGRNGIIGIITPTLDTQFASELILGAGR